MYVRPQTTSSAAGLDNYGFICCCATSSVRIENNLLLVLLKPAVFVVLVVNTLIFSISRSQQKWEEYCKPLVVYIKVYDNNNRRRHDNSLQLFGIIYITLEPILTNVTFEKKSSSATLKIT